MRFTLVFIACLASLTIGNTGVKSIEQGIQIKVAMVMACIVAFVLDAAEINSRGAK